MNEYLRIARQYFDEFERRELYPGIRSWMLWLGFVLFAAWVVAFIHLGRNGPHVKTWGVDMIMVAVAELAFLLFCNKVQSDKRLRSIERAKSRYAIESDDLDVLKRAALLRLTGAGPQSFLAVAEECSKLMKLKGEHRVASDGSTVSFARRLYDPDSKARLLAIVLSSCAIFVALLPKASPEQGYVLIAAIADPGVRSLIGGVMLLTGMVFFVWIALHQVLESTGGFLRTWITRISPSKSSSDLAVKYFVRDLIALHSRMATGCATSLTCP
jgi:hypothetical protein